MKLSRFIKGIAFLTILSLVYIYLQVQIFDLAYQGKSREKQIHKLIDDNGNETYKILTLKSSNNLGGQLLTDDSDLRFGDRSNIVKAEVTTLR